MDSRGEQKGSDTATGTPCQELSRVSSFEDADLVPELKEYLTTYEAFANVRLVRCPPGMRSSARWEVWWATMVQRIVLPNASSAAAMGFGAGRGVAEEGGEPPPGRELSHVGDVRRAGGRLQFGTEGVQIGGEGVGSTLRRQPPARARSRRAVVTKNFGA